MPHSQGIPDGLIATSVEEIDVHLEANRAKVDEVGHREVVRNGHAPGRTLLTGVGPLEVSRPRVDERKAIATDPEHESFTTGVLPRFLRRTPSVKGVEGVVAALYLKGITTNGFESALRAIYGQQAASISATTVSRLKDVFSREYEQWRTAPVNGSQAATKTSLSRHSVVAGTEFPGRTLATAAP